MVPSARQADELLEDDPREEKQLSIWFWIVPTMLMLLFVAFFAIHRRHVVLPSGPISGVGVLPQLGAVQFDSGSSALTPDGQATLDRAAEAMHGNPNVHLRLEGYDAPPVKLKRHDHPRDRLTIQRALSVQTYLDARGVERSRISGLDLGRHPTNQPTAISERNVDSRRAELYAQ